MDHDYRFDGDIRESSKLWRAYLLAMDVRKFEIELYWKRATYFWTFIGVTLAAYLAVLTGQATAAQDRRSDVLFTLACVGVVFAVAWYFVNRGSKRWQRNWEYQVDILEGKALGPLYKTVFVDKHERFVRLLASYPFSVSNINHILSLFVVCLFLLLAAYAQPCWGYTAACGESWPKMIVAFVSLLFIACLGRFGKTAKARAGSPPDQFLTPEEIAYLVRRVDVESASPQ